MNVRRELDSFAVGQTKHLVVVKDGVHILNPQSIDWTIADDPLMSLRRLLDNQTASTDQVSQ